MGIFIEVPHGWDVSMSTSPNQPTQVPAPALPKVRAAVALQLSGHLLGDCHYSGALMHVQRCRELFERCDVFFHTWTSLWPPTPHWCRLTLTSYLLLATCYLLLTTCYLLLAARCLLLAPCFLLLASCCLLLAACCLLLAACCLLLAACCLLLAAYYL